MQGLALRGALASVPVLGLVAGVGLLVMAPIGSLTELMVLMIGLNLLLISMIGRRVARQRAVAQARQDQRRLHLLRRTIPHLRARRPVFIVEQQVRWRRAAEAHRRRNRPIAGAAND